MGESDSVQEDYQRIRDRIRQELLTRLDQEMGRSDEEVLELIEEKIIEAGRQEYLSLSDKNRLRRELFFGIRKLDLLQEIMEDPQITEIMVNGREHIFIEKQGRLERFHGSFETTQKLEDVIERIVSACNRMVNERDPIVDARLSDGSRVHVVLRPIALNGPILTIRRFPQQPVTMEKLLELGSITKEAADFLTGLVVAGYNIFISGGTGSGKTTFLNVLSGFIPRQERIITIEDSAELQIQGVDNLVSLETRNANMEDVKPITIRDLIRAALRMRPDRIIVGEVRGAEAMDMLQAFNTGHDGSLSTGHANSAEDMIARLESMVLMGVELPLAAIRRQIGSGIDIMVHLGRLRDRSRKVLSVREMECTLDGEIRLHTLYEFEETGEDDQGRILGTLVKKGELKDRRKLLMAGMGGEDGI
ncbi:MAG: Flp pilus assembly complex ATPase component TadA [Lachnospiraceae bacterium]|nr:Flp pilus assembly complex ATPase component TadA [Lachnospiraceae bacterium]